MKINKHYQRGSKILKKIKTTQFTTTTDTLTIIKAVMEAAFDAAINTTNNIIETFLKSNTEAA